MSGTFDVQTWSPTQLGVVDDDYLDRLSLLYRGDSALHGTVRGGPAAAGDCRRRADGRARTRAAAESRR